MDATTLEEQERARSERLNEPGTEPPCPFCQTPRVSRNSYVRCNPCGVNWLDEEMHLPNYINSDPRVARRTPARTEGAMQPIAELQEAAAS